MKKWTEAALSNIFKKHGESYFIIKEKRKGGCSFYIFDDDKKDDNDEEDVSAMLDKF